ncbi:hypothetical protein ABQE48_01565 [Mycolicibacterium thermoresistibile]
MTFNESALHDWAHSSSTTIQYANGTRTTIRDYSDGHRSITIKPPDRPEGDVPLKLFNHPILSTASAGMSGLEAQAGHGIPMLTAEPSGYVRIGAEYVGMGTSAGGPWLAIPAVFAASAGGQALGNWLGNTLCPR